MSKKNKKGEEKGVQLNAVKNKELHEVSLEEEMENTELVEKENKIAIEEAFGQGIVYEEISGIENSPMNEPVKEGEVSEGIIEPVKSPVDNANLSEQVNDEYLPEGILDEIEFNPDELIDAPEQVFDEEEESEEYTDNKTVSSQLNAAKDEHSLAVADGFIGIANQLLEVGGGFLVKVKRTTTHIHFDNLLDRSPELTLVKLSKQIDEQNKRNINRIKLDDSDIALLKPVMVEVLQNQTKQLTPEQRLAAIGISIAMKKAQAVVEMKKENKAFSENLNKQVQQYCDKLEAQIARQEAQFNRKDDEGKEEITKKAA